MRNRKNQFLEPTLKFEKTDNLGNITFKSVEVKNWKDPHAIGYHQFKAYIESGHKFEYFFNGNSTAMKIQFENIFKDTNKAQELWNLNPAFFQGLSPDIIIVDNLIDLANDGVW